MTTPANHAFIRHALSRRVKPRKYSGEPFCFIQPKLNGHRATLITTSDQTFLIPRKVEQDYYPFMGQIHERCRTIPKLSIIDGEVVAPSNLATDVPTALRDGSAEFRPFCVYGDFTFGGMETFCVSHGFSPVPGSTIENFCHDLEVPVPSTVAECLAFRDTLEGLATELKIEGYVLKEFQDALWYKVKPTYTIDAVVMRVTKSTSMTKYGLLKALIVGCYQDGELVEIANVGTGFSDEERESLISDPPIGRVCEVEYQSFEKRRLEFPRFLRWRDDKPAEECVI